MPSRELVYRVNIDVGSARQQARQMRQSIESELRNVSAGNINPRSAGSTGVIAQGASDAASAVGALNRTLGVLGVTLGVAQVARFAVDLTRLGTTAARAKVSFEILSGSAKVAETNIKAIQRAGGGTIDTFTAIQIGTQATALKLARTSDEFERLTRTARLIASASPVINDINDALTQLSLFAANEKSFLRADQLLLEAKEVKDRMKDLMAENDNLTASQAKLEASMQLVEEKMGGTLNTIEAQASGIEKLTVAWGDLQVAVATSDPGAISEFFSIDKFAGDVAGVFSGITAEINGESENIAFAIERINDSIQFKENEKNRFLFPRDTDDEIASLTQQLDYFKTVAENTDKAIDAGADGSKEFASKLDAVALAIGTNGSVTNEHITVLQELDQWYRSVGEAAIAAASGVEQANAAEQLAAQRSALILEDSGSIGDSLLSRTEKSVEVIGIDAALATLKEQKALVDSAIDELIASGISDPDEIALRISQIEDQALSFFDSLEDRAGEISIDFTGIDTALGQFDAGFVDFLPGIDDLRSQLIDLQSEIAYTGSITAEQAAELEYLEAAAAAVSGEAVFLEAVTNDLGTAFLSTNEEAAGVIDAMYQATAAYLAGQISAQEYAGVTASLGAQLLALASEAGVATGAIQQLIAAQGGLSGTAGFTVGQNRGNAIGQGISTRTAARERESARREAERAAAKAAREAESAAKRAGRELEKGAERAARELEGALKSVPGLFSPTSVTDEDMQLSAAGVYTDQADEYLRRLRDEVLNGTDWADVSIDEAKQSLRDLGINVADDNRIALEQFEQAWANQSLFAEADNVGKYINEGAVQAALDLQEKSKQGAENIIAHFGGVVESAVESVVSGAGGSVSGGVATIPVQAQLIPASDDLTAIPTLGGISPVLDVAAIQGQLDTLTLPAFDVDTATMVEKINTDLSTITPPTVTVTPDVDTTTLAMQLSQIGSQRLTLPIYTDLETESFLAVFEKIQSTRPTVGVRTTLDIPSFTDLFTQVQSTKVSITGSVSGFGLGVESLADLDIIGKSAADLVKASIAKNIGTTQFVDGEIVAPIATGLASAINTQVRGTGESFQNIGRSVDALILNGAASGFQSTSAEGGSVPAIAYGLIGEVNRQFDETQNFFYAAGLGPANSVLSGFHGAFSATNADGSSRSTLVSGMLDSITQGIRVNAENFRQRGGTIAIDMQHGFASQFGNEDFKNSVIFAGELMAGYLKQGILRNLNGVADAISSKVMDDLSSELEAPQ